MNRIIIVLAIVIVAASPAYFWARHHVAASACVAGPEEQCPSDIQLSERAEMRKLEEKYKQPVPEKEGRIRYGGLVADFSAGAPKDFHWDEKKMRWVKNPPPAPTVPVIPSK